MELDSAPFTVSQKASFFGLLQRVGSRSPQDGWRSAYPHAQRIRSLQLSGSLRKLLLRPNLSALDHPVGHGSTAQVHALSGPDLLPPGQRQTSSVLFRHNISHRERRCQAMLHERNGWLHIGDVGKTGVLFAVLAGISHGLVG